VRAGAFRTKTSGWAGALFRTPKHFAEERAVSARVDEILAFVGMGGRRDLPAKALPYGEQRKLEIAIALAAEPRLLLLDEPAAGLTPAEQAALAATLSDLNCEGLAILVVEHSVAFLRALAPRLVCLVEGRVIADGPAERVIADPRVVEAYLGGAHRGRVGVRA
jgi:branched-chain amino acid transport system ATP-binding protein